MLSSRVTTLAKTLRHLSVREKINLCGLFSLYSGYLFALLLIFVRAQTGINNEADQDLYFGAWLMVLPMGLILTAIHGIWVHRMTKPDSQWRSYLYRIPVAYNAVYLAVLFYLLTYSHNPLSLVYYVLAWFPINMIVLSGFALWLHRSQKLHIQAYIFYVSVILTLLFGVGYGLQSIQTITLNQDGTTASLQIYPAYDRTSECYYVTWQADNVQQVLFDNLGRITTDYNVEQFCDGQSHQFKVLTPADNWVTIDLEPATLIFTELLIMLIALAVLPCWGYRFFNLLAVGVLATFVCLMLQISLLHVVSVGMLAVFLSYLPLSKFHVHRTLIDLIVIAIVILFTLNLDFVYDRWHYNTWLSTINDIMNGKTLLVDVTNQHGIFSLYFQALIFSTKIIPLNYHVFSLLINIFTVLDTILLYFIIRFITKSYSLSTVGTLLIVYLFAVYADWRHIEYPSLGVLRFGMIYVLMFVIVLRYRFYPDHRFAYIPELIVVGLASFWSIFIAAYTIMAYVVLIGFEAISTHEDVKQVALRIVQRLLGMSVPIIFAGIVVYLITFLRSGAFPQWNLYFDYVTTFNTSIPSYQRAIRHWELEFFVLLIEYLTVGVLLMGVLFSRRKQWQPTALTAVIVGGGIIQIYFYIQLSVSAHFITLLFPGIVAGLYWLSHYGHVRIFANFRVKSLENVVWSGVVLILTTTSLMSLQYYMFPDHEAMPPTMTPFRVLVETLRPTFPDEESPIDYVRSQWHNRAGVFFGKTGPHESSFASNYVDISDEYNGPRAAIKDVYVEDAVALIEKYSPDTNPIGLFIPAESFIQTLVTVGKTHPYPVGDPSGVIHSPSTIALIEQTELLFQLGDKIYVLDDLPLIEVSKPQAADDVYTFLKDIVLETCQAFSFRLLDTTPSGVAVMELIDHQDNISCSDDYLAFAEIQVDVGNSLNPDMFVSGWQSPEQWEPETIRWMQQDANIVIPACVNTSASVTMQLFNPADTVTHLTVTSDTFTQEMSLDAGWGTYSFDVDDSLCLETNKTVLALSTDYQMPLETDPRELSIAVDTITIASR